MLQFARYTNTLEIFLIRHVGLLSYLALFGNKWVVQSGESVNGDLLQDLRLSDFSFMFHVVGFG